LKPVKITKSSPKELLVVWEDGHESLYPLELLRDRCPCASCSGETVLLQRYVPPPPDKNAPGRYSLRGAVPVGSYALQLTWGDGHDAGIYSWERLWAECPCGRHASGH
jgi:DUF971 family protein